MNVTTIGIDLAKNSFSVHGVAAHGKTRLRQNVNRGKLLSLLAQQPASFGNPGQSDPSFRFFDRRG